MVTRTLLIVRNEGLYRVFFTRSRDGDLERSDFGIPAKPKKYDKWLDDMRNHNYSVNEYSSSYPGSWADAEAANPSALPRLPRIRFNHYHLIDLDCEVLFLDGTAQFMRRRRRRRLLAGPAIKYPEPNWEDVFDYTLHFVTPKTHIRDGAHKMFLAYVTAEMLREYRFVTSYIGLRWKRNSFPFHELSFALISLTSGHARFHPCPPETGELPYAQTPFLEFGSMRHHQYLAPGASGEFSTFWHGDDILISLVLVVDGAAIAAAAKWGLRFRRHFYVIVLSLFEVSLAEIGPHDRVTIRATKPIPLSSLRPEDCMSMHPLTRAECKPGVEKQYVPAEWASKPLCIFTAADLEELFPGVCALVNFFDIVARRRTATKSAGVLPAELYYQILDHVDHDTWKACQTVSPILREYCLARYWLDEQTRIVAGPSVRVQSPYLDRVLSFDLQDMTTGEVVPMLLNHRFTDELSREWVPLLGRGEREVVMSNVFLRFSSAADHPVVEDGEPDEW
ncbi:hypothetical protein QBC47DRAFT_457265 [Echria macrotheca]|uniref:Uncharacterized protein n=1 Tax=Echria macrotheca TaxID=438768 RepID=A0AAJ0BIE9_9PEZI|nr:hypothetical protein QBC47DRAFT_457265 [Echria macrotheca]